jgi:S-adenosylmethionine hydrolase
MSIVTLTTDFGQSDHYVAVMKGVILTIHPRVRIVDITHEITPFERVEGAFTIAQAYRWFPRGTVHVVVVDPGVGTRRRAILVEAAGQRFVGPDNGVFTLLYEAEPKHKVRHITASRYLLPEISATFHGRDVFSPVAAHLAAGVPPSKMGPRIDDYVRLGGGFDRPARTAKRVWTGTVLKVDRFGNLITNFRLADFPSLLTRPFRAQVGMHDVTVLAGTFQHIPPGETALVSGSSGYLEVCRNEESAARALGCGSGTPVELTLWSAPEEDRTI